SSVEKKHRAVLPWLARCNKGASNRHSQSSLKGEAVHVGTLSEPKGVEATLRRVAPVIRKPFIEAVVGAPQRSSNGRQIIATPELAECSDLLHHVHGAGADLVA